MKTTKTSLKLPINKLYPIPKKMSSADIEKIKYTDMGVAELLRYFEEKSAAETIKQKCEKFDKKVKKNGK